MSSYRLRYKASDFDLPVGDFVVGRGSDCHLVLDDALVSRQHGVFRCEGGSVLIEDLGSRNGILVNAVKIAGPTLVSHLDRVILGSQELVLIEESLSSTDRKTIDTGTLKLNLPELQGQAQPEEETRVLTGLSLLLSIAEKALSLDRFDEAERLLSGHLVTLLDRLREGARPPRKESVESATVIALRLAEGLKKTDWVDWVFEIHERARFLPTAEAVDTLHRIVRTIGYDNPRALRRCLESLSSKPSLSPADRFVLSRLTGLERVISA